MKKTSMRDIAKATGVSVVTVSNALGGKPGLSEAVRQRVRAAAERMGYEYPVAGNRPGKSALDIGVLIPERYFQTTESYYGMLYGKLVKQLTAEGHFALLQLLTAEDEERLELPALIRNRHVDGLILLGEPSKAYYRTISRVGIPVLFLDFYDELASADSVVGDNTYGCYRLTGHLIREGHESIGFVGTPQATASIMDRYLGYYRAVVSHGMEIRPDWIVKDRTEEGTMCEIELPEELPEALVCNCDIVARRVIAALEKRGLRVPRDISVTGFDDFTDGSEAEPLLSTFRIDTDDMIGIAVRKITERCNGSEAPFERTVVGGQPVYRDSDRCKNES